MTTEEFFKHSQQNKKRGSKQQINYGRPLVYDPAKAGPASEEEDIVIPIGVKSVTPKKNGNFIRLTDKTIISIKDIILVNVETTQDGKEKFCLYLEGKHMTLRLSEEDYLFIDHCLMEEDCAEDE